MSGEVTCTDLDDKGKVKAILFFPIDRTLPEAEQMRLIKDMINNEPEKIKKIEVQ